MIEYAYKDLYKQDSVQKEVFLNFGDFQITNSELYAEAFELSESLCSQEELRFGCCEASVLKFKCRNEFGELKDKWVEVGTVLDGNNDDYFRTGFYKVFSDEPSGDKKYKNVTAYDAMYDVINAEMVEWYDGLEFPITMRDFRKSFFAYLGIEQVEIELINDDMLIDKTIDADSISGKTIITAICEINGVFGHINRNGLFDYIALAKRKQVIYPGMGIYPGSGIYPGMTFDTDYAKEEINTYISCEYGDFETQMISKLQIRQEENDIGVIQGTGTNTYIVQDNFLVYGKSSDELKIIANRLFTKINGVYYRPFKASLRGNPCIEVGDIVVFHTRYKEVEGYVLERTLKGIQALKDTFESKGVYEYAEKVNSVRRDIKKLKGKTNVLERSVEQTRSEIKDIESGMSTQIKQLSDSVAVVIDKNGKVITNLTLDKNGMSFVGDKVVFKSENFNLDEEGNLSISGRYSVEYTRTFYASDYTEADRERVLEIANHVIEPTEKDYEKYDFKGTGISAYSAVVVSNMILGKYDWTKYTYKITIDPKASSSLVKTELLNEWSDGSSRILGNVNIGGMGVSATEATFDSLEVTQGANGTFTTADGKTVTVQSGIITEIS